MNNILCFKWGDKYGAQYVNNLYNSMKRNSTVDFRFICVTDDIKGINSGVDCLPLLDDSKKGWWQKITAFKSPLHDIQGNVLLTDLDMVIVDNIDEFFTMEGDFIMEQDAQKSNGNSTCFMRFAANQHSDIYDKFPSNIQYANATCGFKAGKYWGDQIWVNEQRPNPLTWNTDWIKSYKWECKARRNDVKSAFSIPKGCKVIKFHGKPTITESLHDVGEYWK